jgi:hypothetical protein
MLLCSVGAAHFEIPQRASFVLCDFQCTGLSQKYHCKVIKFFFPPLLPVPSQLTLISQVLQACSYKPWYAFCFVEYVLCQSVLGVAVFKLIPDSESN